MPSTHRDDSDMSRFEREGVMRFRARQGVLAVILSTVALVLFAGEAVHDAGEQASPGVWRDIMLAVGSPAQWVSDNLPFASSTDSVTAGLSPDAQLGGGGFDATVGGSKVPSSIPPVTPDYFDPAEIGAQPGPKQTLDTLLVTGDSLATPLDLELGRRLADSGVDVVRDPHLATGISKSDLLDWGKLSTSQVARYHPDAVVVFIGANEGFPMTGPDGASVECCGADWAAVYANRVRQMMSTYMQGGAARVYWLTVPTPRDSAHQEIERVVNAGIKVAAEPFRSRVDVIDTVPIFTPGDTYRDSMDIDGNSTIVREPDGIHLNDAGSALAADYVLKAIDENFTR
jgi:lysophospholipase L1-like esterase